MSKVHASVLDRGFAVADGDDLGLLPWEFTARFAGALVPDPQGPGKQHARDVVGYRHTQMGTVLAECESVAFTSGGGTRDDYSRFSFLDAPGNAAATVLHLVPPPLRRPAGEMSADFFRYGPGVESGPHRDSFGDVVVIWCLGREGDGAENFLLQDQDTVFHRALEPGEVLVFRDELFLHGITPLTGDGAWRDALICITLKEPA